MIIIDVELADFCDYGTTVSVTAAASGFEETFHVQTTNGCYEPGAGCWIITDKSDGCVDEDAQYNEFDFECIAYEAEKKLRGER